MLTYGSFKCPNLFNISLLIRFHEPGGGNQNGVDDRGSDHLSGDQIKVAEIKSSSKKKSLGI